MRIIARFQSGRADIKYSDPSISDLDELGLCAAVTALIGDWNRRCARRPSVHGHCDAACDSLPAPLAAEILRIVQECVTHAVRHAEASLIVVALARDEDGYTVEISDDGRGAAETAPGFGLNGLRERAAACAGSLDIQHQASGGLAVRLTIPASNFEPAP